MAEIMTAPTAWLKKRPAPRREQAALVTFCLP